MNIAQQRSSVSQLDFSRLNLFGAGKGARLISKQFASRLNFFIALDFPAFH